MYKYLKKIPQFEYDGWAKEFVERYAKSFQEIPTKEIYETFYAWVENLKANEHGTKVIKYYDLTLTVRDFFNSVIKRDRDRLVDTYPEAFI